MLKALNLLLSIVAPQCHAFTVANSNLQIGMSSKIHEAKHSTSSELSALLSIELEKPLGIILEEVEENSPLGVKVEELSDAGSAYASEYRDQLVGLKVAQVMDTDVTNMVFDDVMDCIIGAPSPVKITFEVDDDAGAPVTAFEAGTAVQIKVIQEGVDDKTIDAKVGDNLRKTLLDNKVELYRGLKKKLGNCGGGGQCTFCAVDFVESEGWQERMEYEETKIGKFPSARLACLNNIQGPATIRVQ
jgi:ferredoxin